MKTPLILLLTSLVLHESHPCPDRWALSQVDAWVHGSLQRRGQHKKAVSFYDLDNHEMIELTKANVSVLCDGMIKNMNKLKYLTMVEANISKIHPGAFQNLPALTHLSLSINHLSSIERYQFQNLESLRVLYLSSNLIDNVDEDAFADLVQLRKIFLDRNQIHEIDSKWFLTNLKISLIDLSFNNVSKLQTGAFTLADYSTVEIRLQSNEIEEVERAAVTSNAGDEAMPYLTLHLDHNNLTDIPADFVKSMDKFQSKLFFNRNTIKCFAPATLRILKEVTLELHADDNPLSCDCLEAASSFVKDHELTATFSFSSTIECQLPGLRPDRWNQSPQNLYFEN